MVSENMQVQIQDNKIIAIAELKREDWWLVCEGGEPGNKNGSFGIWTLNRKIDRSYKGKDPDVAVPALWLEPDIAEALFDKLDIVWM